MADKYSSEMKKIWSEINAIKQNQTIAANTSEKEAFQHSRKASEYRNKCQSSFETAKEYLGDIESSFTKINSIENSVKTKYDEISSKFIEFEELNSLLSEKSDSLQSTITALNNELNSIEELSQNSTELNERIESIKSLLETSEELNEKITAINRTVTSKKKDIDEVYTEIFGYKSEENSEENVEGLKEELEKAYNNIENEINEIEETVKTFIKNSKTNLTLFQDQKEDELSSTLENWKNDYLEIEKQINSLLPSALSTGLSYAYSEKKTEEQKDLLIYQRKFRNATIGLVIISVIPFIVGTISLFDGKTLEDVILSMPRLVLAIFPLYVPILWLAYSANKNQKLSKRLIEEYTHKEVISKTYEGLSTQIENLKSDKKSFELRQQLLYNIISSSSENPGKLISDYNKSDHPLTDALDKSINLANAIEKLSKVPGISKLTSVLEKKSDKIISKTAEKVEKGINSIEIEPDEKKEEENENLPEE